MALTERLKEIENELAALPTWEAKYEKIISWGKSLPAMDEALKSEDLKVKGCQSQVWLKADLHPAGHMSFQADSDAVIVKGLVAVLLKLFNGATPKEVLEFDPRFLAQLGFQENLSPNRANGFLAMIKQMRHYATAYQVLLDMKKSLVNDKKLKGL